MPRRRPHNDRQDFVGQTVNLAARVRAPASLDGILASEPIARNAEAARLLEERKVHARSQLQSLRGIAEQMPIYELS